MRWKTAFAFLIGFCAGFGVCYVDMKGDI